MRLAVHILTWNDRRYLPELFASLDAQTFRDFTVRLLDNGSSDETLAFIQAQVPQWLVGRNVKNLGFTEGHNQLIRYTLGHLHEAELDDWAILIMNPDMMLAPNMLAELVRALEANFDIDAVQPKIYRAFGEHVGDESLEDTVRSDVIDTTGMRVKRGWRMVDRGAGEIDSGQFDEQTELFAPTGTCALWRARAVSLVREGDEFYDSDFFTYREDCDLAWRWRTQGHRSAFVPTAKAWHYRGMFGAERQGWWSRLKNRRQQRPFFAALSTRNQLLVLFKNMSLGSLLRHAPWVLFLEGGRILYATLFEPESRRQLLSIIPLLPKMWRKRRALRKRVTEDIRVLEAYVGV